MDSNSVDKSQAGYSTMHVDFPSKIDLTERQIFRRVTNEIVNKLGLKIDPQDLNAFIEKKISSGKMLMEQGRPVEDEVPLPRKEWKGKNGVTVKGYQTDVEPDFQKELVALAKQPSKNQANEAKTTQENQQGAGSKRPEKGGAGNDEAGAKGSGRENWSAEYTERVDSLMKQAAVIRDKFEAMNGFYQEKGQRDGLGTYMHHYLSRSAADAEAMRKVIQEAGAGPNTALILEKAVQQYGDVLDQAFGRQQRDRSPQEIRKFLDNSYKAGFDNWNGYAEWIGMIPTPATRGVEFGMKLLANSLKLYSGDISAGDMALYTIVDSGKMVVGNYSDKIKAMDGGKTLDFMANMFTNICDEVTKTHKMLKDNPAMNSDEAYKYAVGSALAKSFTGIDLKGKFGIAAEAAKDFGGNMGKHLLSEYADIQKTMAANPNADQTQLWKEGAARALVKTFVEGTGKSLKEIAGDDDALKRIYEVANKLGVQEPLKNYFKREVNAQADGKVSSRGESLGGPSASILQGVRNALPLPKVTTEQQVQTLANALEARCIQDKVAANVITTDANKTMLFARESPFLRTYINVEKALEKGLEQSQIDLSSARNVGGLNSQEQEERRNKNTPIALV